MGVSRRIDSDKERRRLREIVERLRTKDLGFIIRTAGDGVREADLDADIRYLTSVWDEVQSKIGEQPAPAVLYSELDLPLKMIRDFANDETKRIAVDSQEVYEQMKSFVDRFVADPKPRSSTTRVPLPSSTSSASNRRSTTISSERSGSSPADTWWSTRARPSPPST